MFEIQLDQGTDDWLAWRAGKAFTDLTGASHEALDGPRITATAASVCGGHSPFNTPHGLWGEFLGLRKREIASFVMERGSAMEPHARAAYNAIVGEVYEPVCIQSERTPWAAASLDGVDAFRSRGVEIKCPFSENTHGMAILGKVPDYYFDQIQWQLLCGDDQLLEIDYFSYAPKLGKADPITVKPDLIRQQELLQASLNFRLAVITRVPLSGNEFDQAAKQYLILSRKMDELQAQVEAAKERVKTLAGGQAVQGGGVQVIVADKKGSVSWEKVSTALVEKFKISKEDLEEVKTANTGKPGKTISVREAADADAVYAEIKASMSAQSETSIVTVPDSEEAVSQPNPNW
jgi:putative phage-type endonuclease